MLAKAERLFTKIRETKVSPGAQLFCTENQRRGWLQRMYGMVWYGMDYRSVEPRRSTFENEHSNGIVGGILDVVLNLPSGPVES
ncbi:hypothetical protein M0804_009704 [Polistes exclamans]|nr:hypothetical protein M0804_009704 [Polistes exclamans]